MPTQFNWINEPSASSVDNSFMRQQIPQDLREIFNDNNTGLRIRMPVSSDKLFLADSPQVRMAFLPYTVTAILAKLPKLQVALSNTTMSRPQDIDDYAQTDSYDPEWNTITVIELRIQRGESIRDAFNRVPMDHRTMTMALTLDGNSFIRLIKRADNHWLILTNRLSHGLILRLASIVPILYPVYKDANVYPEQLPILLVQDKLEEYVQTLRDWAIPIYRQLVDDMKWTALEDSLSSIYRSRLDNARQAIASQENDINSLMHHIRENYQQLNNLRLQLMGMEQQGDTNFTDLIAFIKRCPEVRNITNTGREGQVQFTVSLPCTHWDVTHAEILINSRSGNCFNNHEDVKRACRWLFLEQKARIWFNVTFRINFITGALGNADFDINYLGIPNQHIYRHNCWGSNEPEIVRAIRNGVYEAAFAQALAACGSLNMSDSTVLGGMMEGLRGGGVAWNRGCIEVEGHEGLMKWYDFLQYCKRAEASPAPAAAADEGDTL